VTVKDAINSANDQFAIGEELLNVVDRDGRRCGVCQGGPDTLKAIYENIRVARQTLA
jgi:hypothetical protein